jgi:short-subunit dehydrogenase
MRIEGTVVLLTGASSGIVAVMARQLAAAGAKAVLLVGRNAERLTGAAQDVEGKGGRARTYVADLTDQQAVGKLARQVSDEVGAPDILINNAGGGTWRFLHEGAEDDIERDMAVPYFAAARLTRAVLPGMMQRGSGHIVNISSVASRMAWPGATSYIAACRAMRGLSDALRADLSVTAIKVTHYESGPIDSPYWHNNPGSRERVPGIARILVPTLTEEQAARAVIQGIRGDKAFVVTPVMLQAVYLLHFCSPWLVQWLMTASGYRPSARAAAARTAS